jgi:hypothetical protein
MSIEKPTAGPIHVHQTPNPNALKFVLPGIRFAVPRNYSLGDSVGDVVEDALAARLLTLEGVYNVFLAQDFVTVNKVPHVEWLPLQAAVESCLADYLTQNTSNNAA